MEKNPIDECYNEMIEKIKSYPFTKQYPNDAKEISGSIFSKYADQITGLYLKKTDYYDADTFASFYIKVLNAKWYNDIEVLQITSGGSTLTVTSKKSALVYLQMFELSNKQVNKIILKLLDN